ncbi:MAG: hypothetical protein QOD72_2712 [Acidimicrobiaceae bacterium]|jgi:hypothetical protein|nr:hypothetical protein [Acidimicrobiaceae bacterium]
MCTYLTTYLEVEGSGKGPEGWFPLTDVTVYYDHPVHAWSERTLNIDFFQLDDGVAKRVAVELDPASARAIAAAIVEMLDTAPVPVLEPSA